MAYATHAQLTDWIGSSQTVPEQPESDRLLERASTLIDRATVAAIYDTDANGIPSADDIIQVFADATCAQVAYWIATDDELGQTAGLTQVTQGGAHLTGRFPRLAPQAYDVLLAGGLIPVVGVSP